MAELGETVTLNGVTYRTEAAHEAALREAVALLKNGHASAPGTPDGALQVLARLDVLRKAIESLREQPSTLALPVSLVQRLERIEAAVDPKTTGSRTRAIVEEWGQGLSGRLEGLAERLATIENVGLSLAKRLESIEEQQRLLVELLDTATAPPPPPARVPPQITRSATPAPEVPADPTPFPPSPVQQTEDPLIRYLTDPTLTTGRLGQEWGVSDQTVSNRLYKMAEARGPVAVAALRERMRRHGRKPSRSAAVGSPPPPSTAAGS